MSIPEITPYPMPADHDVPESAALWTVRPARAVLLIHDMQKYFIRFFPCGEPPIVDLMRNIGLLRRRCAELGVPVAYTVQPGGMSDEERGLLKDFWGPGMTVEPRHRDVVEPLQPGAGDLVLTKWRYSALHRTELLSFLRRTGRDQLVICGVYAHVGCLMTAAEAFSNDIQPFLVADAVADFSLEYHRLALTYAAERCAAVLTTEAALAVLGASPLRSRR
jgi:isochorismate hydrolase